MHGKLIVIITLAAALFINTGYGVAQENKDAHPGDAKVETYKIKPEDVLEILTWKEPDFTKAVKVRIDGRISFPLIDEIEVSGRTALDVKQEIEKKLKNYIESPLVTVSVLPKPAIPPMFYILGEVKKTGVYQITGRLTLLQAFAIAGGFTEWASKKEIILIRHKDGKDTLLRLNYKNIIKGRDLDQNVPIQPDDTIIVP